MITKEYILHEDGMFYQRESIMTPIVSQQNLVKSCKLGDSMSVSSLTHRFRLVTDERTEEVTELHYKLAEYIGVSTTAYAFVNIPSFKFPRANLKSQTVYNTDGSSEEAVLLFPRPVTHENGAFTPDLTPAFEPRYADLYILHKIDMNQGTRGTNFVVHNPYLFGILKDDKTPVVFNLPNIYDNGRICTGNDYGIDLEQFDNIHSVIKHLTTEIYRSPANNDLRASEEQELKYLRFDLHGNHINNDDKPKGRFINELTYAPAVDFTNLQ